MSQLTPGFLGNTTKSGHHPMHLLSGLVTAWLIFELIMRALPHSDGTPAEGVTLLAIIVGAGILTIKTSGAGRAIGGFFGVSSIPLALLSSPTPPAYCTGQGRRRGYRCTARKPYRRQP